MTILQILAVKFRHLKAKTQAKDKLPVSDFNQQQNNKQRCFTIEIIDKFLDVILIMLVVVISTHMSTELFVFVSIPLLDTTVTCPVCYIN